MANWLKRRPGACREAESRIQELLNSSASESREELLASADPALLSHVARCKDCGATVEEGISVRQMLHRELRPAEDPGEGFTLRVMQAIAAREAERNSTTNPWFALPALAARFAWVSAVALLLATSWLYEMRPAVNDQRNAIEVAGTYLEPTPPPTNQDDVLGSLVGSVP
jgi:hypothetical protein